MTFASVAVVATTWTLTSPFSGGCAAAAVAGVIPADPSTDAAFVAAINSVRAANGVGGLAANGNLTDVARDWSIQMATAGQISHRDDLHAGVTASWSAMGENVGQGGNVTDLMGAFTASPHHLANMIDPQFNSVGVGSAVSGGTLYTTQIFMAARTAGQPVVAGATAEAPTPPETVAPAPAPAPKKAPAPRTTTPPTTVPPPPPTTVPVPVTVAPTTTTTVAPTTSVAPRELAQRNLCA